MNGWKNSSGHNTNMLAASRTIAGIGCFAKRVETSTGHRYAYYWVQLFG